MIIYVYIALIILFVYFVMIRPAQNQKRRQAQMSTQLGIGAEVRTIGGLLGTVVSLEDGSVTVETTPGVRLRFTKNAVAGVVSGADESDAPATDVDAADAVTDADTDVELAEKTETAAEESESQGSETQAAEAQDSESQSAESEKSELAADKR